MSAIKVFTMANDQIWHIVGNLEGDIRAIRNLLEEGNRERTAFHTEMRSFIPKIESSHEWIQEDGKPAVNGLKRAKWLAIGVGTVAGGLGTSPVWLAKVTALLYAIWP